MISSTALLYLERNASVKLNCTVAANPISSLRSEWQKLILFEKFTTQTDDDALDTNDVMYSSGEPDAHQRQLEVGDENELLKEKLAYSYLWNSPNLDWWWSSASATTANKQHLPPSIETAPSKANSLSEYRPFIASNSTVHYNQKVISKNNQMLIVLNDTSTTKPNQQHHLATASLRIDAFLNDTDYLCLIRPNPEKSPLTETPNSRPLSGITARIAVRRKRRPLILSCNTAEIPGLLIYLKEQVADHWQETASQPMRRAPINGDIRKSISVAAEPNDSVSFYCSALRGAAMVQFSWREVKHGQLLGAISHTFAQPSIESAWRRSLNASGLLSVDTNNQHFATTHQQFLNQQSPLTKSELNAQANYTVRLHFNPKLPELITAELRLAKVSLTDFFTQFQCLVSNELGSDSAIFEVRRRSVPDQVNQVHARQLNGHRLVLSWLPGFDGGFHQQYIIRYALKNELERAIQSKQSLASTHTMADLQHPNSVHTRESLNEIRRMKAADENADVLAAEEGQEPDSNREHSPDIHNYGSSNVDIQWRTEQDKRTSGKPYHGGKRKNSRKRMQIKWTSSLLSPNGPIAQIANERLVSNETQIEFSDLKPSAEYYFSVLSKNRLGLAREHSVPILIRTPKADTGTGSSASLDQVQSNLQLGENSLGLIEHGLLTSPKARWLTIWLLVIGGCTAVLVNVVVFTLYCRRRAAAKLTGTLTTADSSSTNSTQSTTLSNSTLSTPQSKSSTKTNPSVCDENQMEPNKKGTIANDNNELRLDDDRSAMTKKTAVDEHCIMNSSNDVPLTNGNVTDPANTPTKSNQIDYLKDKQQPAAATSVNNGQSASLVYAQLRSDNSIANCLLRPTGDLNRYSYAPLHSMPGPLDGLNTLSGPLANYSNFGTNKNCSKSGQILQTRVNKLSADYKDRYIPYYLNGLNDHLLSASLEQDLSGWDSSLIADFYSTNASSLSGKLTSNSLLTTSFTPSPSTYSSQLPHLITSSSLATTNTLSPIDHLTPSTAYSYRTLSSATTTQLDDGQLKLANNYDQFSSPTFTPTFTSQAPPLLVSTLTKNHTVNSGFLAGDFLHPDPASYGSTNYPKLAVKKSPNKSNHCKVVSFQKPVECWMLDGDKDAYYKQ